MWRQVQSNRAPAWAKAPCRGFAADSGVSRTCAARTVSWYRKVGLLPTWSGLCAKVGAWEF